MAKLANAAGIVVIAALISPLAVQRRIARSIVGAELFVEVHVSTPIEVCAARDAKGLYARAKAGSLPNLTGVGAAYEPPEAPDVRVDASQISPEQAAELVLALLATRQPI